MSVLTTAVLILTLAGMIPAPGVSVGEVCAAEAEEDSKGIDGFGSDEGFAIVPQYAGASALDVSAPERRTHGCRLLQRDEQVRKTDSGEIAGEVEEGG